jgi:iron complex outermembrane receptor protein
MTQYLSHQGNPKEESKGLWECRTLNDSPCTPIEPALAPFTSMRFGSLTRSLISNLAETLRPTVRGLPFFLPGYLLLTMIVLAAPPASAQSASAPDLTQKSLEDLMNVEVTSVSKKEQKTSQVAAAIFVISRGDILRSGALNVPDLLRLAPGVEVAQLDASRWAISVRGFNGQESNKLLVMIDGRTVYNPVFAGVFWDSQNVPLDSIDRIEVIRGPGAAVWGANAVNGVINIITRKANDTQGASLSGGAGNDLVGPATVRYGGTARLVGAYRVYAEGFHEAAQRAADGSDGEDDWRLVHGGFRTDRSLSVKDSLTTEGEAYSGDGGELALVPVSLAPPLTSTLALREHYSGWNILSRWTRAISQTSQSSLQVSFDRTSRDDTTYAFNLNTLDIDFQQHIGWGSRQDFVWGLGYRVISTHTSPTFRISFQPKDRNLQLFESFAQDEITLIPKRLFFTLGGRLDHNVYTGFDFEPASQLVWTPNDHHTFWASASSADRTPARSDTDIRVNLEAVPGPGGLPLLVSYLGNPEQKNEHLTAFEAGYRDTISDRLSLDSAVFFNRYRDLTSVEPRAVHIETSPLPAHLLMPWTFANGLYGETHGMEVFANWQPLAAWTVSPGYSFLAMHIHKFTGSQDMTDGPGTEGTAPDNGASLRSQLDLPGHLQWNASAYFVDRLPAVSVPSYTRLDSGLTWLPGERWSFSVVGQNLLKSQHQEFAGVDSSVESGRIRRNAYARINWSF